MLYPKIGHLLKGFVLLPLCAGARGSTGTSQNGVGSWYCVVSLSTLLGMGGRISGCLSDGLRWIDVPLVVVEKRDVTGSPRSRSNSRGCWGSGPLRGIPITCEYSEAVDSLLDMCDL